MPTSSVWAVIPVFEGAATVAAVVEGVRAATGLPVLVIDDGSTDGSGAAAEAAGALVVRHRVNQGKGSALRTAFSFADRVGARAVLTLDADGQHDPAEAPALLAAHEACPDALVVGVRRFDPALMPRRSRVGNNISTWWISKFARRPHADTQSGFRVYPRALWSHARLRTTRFDTETELLLVAAKRGLPLVEVPIRTLYLQAGDAKPRTHFRNVRDTLRIIELVIGSPWWPKDI